MSSASPVTAAGEPPTSMPPDFPEDDQTFASSEQNHSPEDVVSVISLQQQLNGQDSESITEPDIQQDGSVRAPTVTYCIALYDYEGEEEQELTFDEGEVIRVINKMAHGIDDGWWLGEIDGRVGNFPSLVVEECDEFGEPLECDWDCSPPASAPPVHTPPEAPPDFLLATEVIVTQPTPEIINSNDENHTNEGDTKFGFSMEMTQDNKDKYGQQHNQKDTPTGIPCVVIEAEEDDGNEEVEEGGDDDCGLGVAQIVITAATPMTEEPESSFPPPEEEEQNGEQEEVPVEEPITNEEFIKNKKMKNKPVVEKYDFEEDRKALNGDDLDDDAIIDDQPTDSNNAFPISSSSEGETTGPSTAENSQSQPVEEIHDQVKQVVGGRASIPDELEPHQLARLQDLKESNA